MFLVGSNISVGMPSVNGAWEITAAMRGSVAATASTCPPLNDEPHTTMRSGSTASSARAQAMTAR